MVEQQLLATRNGKKLVKELKSKGWKLDKDFYIYKKVGDKEMDIEFCIGDFCLGIYDKDKWLIEPKQRCKNFMEAYIKSFLLEEKYKLQSKNI